MKTIILVLAGLLCPLLACGQEGNGQAIPPASQKDVRKLEQELKRLRQHALEAEEKAASRSAEERQKIVEDNREAISATEKKLAERMEAIGREAQKANDDQMRTMHTFWYVVGIGVIFFGALLFLLVRKRKAQVVVVRAAPKMDEEIPEILFDPDITAVKTALSKKPEQQFILALQDGRQFECLAELKNGEPFITKIEGNPVLIGWDKRRKSAAKLAAGKT